MVSNIALIVVASLAFGGVIALLLKIHALGKQMWKITSFLATFGEVVDSQLELLKVLLEVDDKNKDALQHLSNRQEYHIVLAKYILACTRLDFMDYKNCCIENDDYENAAQLEKTIRKIEELLSTE